MSEAICGLLSELEEKGWKVDYAQFAGKASIVMVPNAEVCGRVVFNTDTDYLSVSFEVDTAFVPNIHTEYFLKQLRARLGAKENVCFAVESAGKFEIGWSIHSPTLFDHGAFGDYDRAFWSQFMRCWVFVHSYTLTLELLGSRPTLRCAERPVRVPDIEHLVSLCVLEQSDSGYN